MNEPRQRVAQACGTAVGAFAVLILAGGCQVGPSVLSAQTAITAAQTALPGLQTALPGVQATAQAGATLVSGVLSDPQFVSTQVQAVLAGVTIDAQTTPDGAANDAITQVTVTGTDVRGTYGQLDSGARQATAGAALTLLGQYYPNATIALKVVDSGGGALITGNKSPGQAPSLQ
ncbi:MAG: hypothetical protein LC797_10745 [Chloroflexi bacterium]|nr:hypothetical protein [Chloroflexota bacterium]